MPCELGKGRSAELVAYLMKCRRKVADVKKGQMDLFQGLKSNIIERSTVTHGACS